MGAVCYEKVDQFDTMGESSKFSNSNSIIISYSIHKILFDSVFLIRRLKRCFIWIRLDYSNNCNNFCSVMYVICLIKSFNRIARIQVQVGNLNCD